MGTNDIDIRHEDAYATRQMKQVHDRFSLFVVISTCFPDEEGVGDIYNELCDMTIDMDTIDLGN